MRVRTRRLCQNRAAMQIGAATGMMNGYWIALVQLGDRRAIVIGAKLASRRRTVEAHHHDAQGHNSDQAVNHFQHEHWRRNSFRLQTRLSEECSLPANRGNSESEGCRCAQGCRREYEIAANLCQCHEDYEGPQGLTRHSGVSASPNTGIQHNSNDHRPYRRYQPLALSSEGFFTGNQALS